MRPRIAMMIIGQELLNGTTADTNAHYAAKRLHELGAELCLTVTVPDDVKAIAEALNWIKDKYDYILTSGGIGSTHDDVTMAGVSEALGQQLVRHPYLKTIVGRFCETTDLTAAQLRLAEIPEGSELIVEDDMHFPQVYVGNIYMLPGIPEYFRQRFERIADRFQGPAIHGAEITVKGIETQFTAALNRAVKLHSEVVFGSYPSLIAETPNISEAPQSCHIKITLEGSDAEKVDAAKRFLLDNIPAGIEVISK